NCGIKPCMRSLMQFAAIVFCTALPLASARAQTPLVTHDTNWTTANSPYVISSSLTVAAGATLTIEPGVTVQLGSGVNLTVANGGRLLAEGNTNNRIRF